MLKEPANPVVQLSEMEKQIAAAFDTGRRAGFATAAVALSVVAFVNMFGAEKAILAIVLAMIALRGSATGLPYRRLARTAIGIASAFIVTVVVVLTVWWDKLAELVTLLAKLS
jgi:hypothetical protein